MTEKALDNNVLVSIGIPFFNCENYLEDAINSVINQSYSNWELILVDDGSSDSSTKIAEQYQNIDSRIKLYCDGTNLGLPSRLNQLSDLALGEYYFRMDADDIMHPERIKTQLAYLIDNPTVDLVGSGLIAIDNQNRIIGLRKGLNKDFYSLNDIVNGYWCVHPTVAGKTVWFKQNKYDPNLKRAQDYDLWIRTIQTSHLSKIEKPLLFYREASTPSLQKYKIAAFNSIKIYVKNREIIGSMKAILFIFIKLVKLFIYFIYNLFNLTDRLIDRRSFKLESNSYQEYKEILETAVKSKVALQVMK